MECRLTDASGFASDYRINATPIVRDNEKFSIFTLEDIQHEKRRQALERTFYHDLLNTAGGVSGLVEVLHVIDNEQEKEALLTLLSKTTQRLVEEIQSGRSLSQAENGTLQLNLEDHDLKELARETVDFYCSHPSGGKGRVVLSPSSEKVMTRTDKAIIHRIISNLVKNALEASEASQVVSVEIREESKRGIFRVHNESVMPAGVKLKVFERSFSTKGTGRGIGTYSVKLFSEKYLKGEVWFTSETGIGTDFFVAIPLLH